MIENNVKVNLDAEFAFFKNNITELSAKYDSKFIVIKGQKVIGKYDSFEDAYFQTIKTERLGTFLIQNCADLDQSSLQVFNTLLVW